MPLAIETFILGPLENNTYLVADSDTRQAVIIDPSFEIEPVLHRARELDWKIEQIWLTHAHFDHIAGVEKAARSFQPALPVALHHDDLDLYLQGGGAAYFGFRLELTTRPSMLIQHGQMLNIGKISFEVRHTPGHSSGHVVFISTLACTAFCGDVIFMGSVGRTDLPGGSHKILMDSITKNILSLDPKTRIYSGHGPDTTVGNEIQRNPFLNG